MPRNVVPSAVPLRPTSALQQMCSTLARVGSVERTKRNHEHVPQLFQESFSHPRELTSKFSVHHYPHWCWCCWCCWNCRRHFCFYFFSKWHPCYLVQRWSIEDSARCTARGGESGTRGRHARRVARGHRPDWGPYCRSVAFFSACQDSLDHCLDELRYA